MPRCATLRPIAVLTLLLLSLCAIDTGGAAEWSSKMRVYFGTYTSGTGPRGRSAGIYLAEMDLEKEQLGAPVVAAEIPNPSFLAINQAGTRLYAVSESRRFEDPNSGGVSAFEINASDGSLKFLNEQPSGGDGPCHLVVDKASKHVLAANYGGGSVVVLPLDNRGALRPASSFIQHEGSSVHARQKGPHAHCINLDAENRLAFCADLGLDKVLIYDFDSERGQITPHAQQAFIEVAAGAGPRHFAFHPSAPFAYVINELNSTITAFRFDADQGRLADLQSVSTLPADFTGNNSTAEIAVSPNGRFVYGSNRGHDSIAVFGINQETGRLNKVSRHPTGGKTPRSFAIDPSGAFLLVANQESHDVTVFRIHPGTGRLEATDERLEIPYPVCVTFAILDE